MTSKKFWKLYLLLLPLLMILAIAGLTGYGATMLKVTPQRAQTTQPVQPLPAAARPPQAENDALKEQATELKNDADALKAKEDDLKWILGFILGAAALFAAGQAAGTWFSAQAFTKQAEGMLADAKGRFSIFSLLQERREASYGKLANLQLSLTLSSPIHSADEGFDWRRRFYEKMPLKLRRELLSAEQLFPYEVIGQDEPMDVYARNLRRLAQFYWSKFIYEQEWGLGSLTDLEHAEYLLDLAIRNIGSVFYLLNDMGNLRIEFFRVHSATNSSSSTALGLARSAHLLNRAREALNESIHTQKRQLRAYHNLAYVEADLDSGPDIEGRLRRAIEILQEGLKHSNWERTPVREFSCSALYNLACYYARLIPWDQSAEASCIAELRKAAALGLASPVDVDRDFNTREGDFYQLLVNGSPKARAELRELERELSNNYL